MNKLPLLVLVGAVVTLVACADPVGDAPRATVSAAAPKPATPTAAPPVAPAAGATRYVFADETGATVAFVAAKVTGKHDGGFKKTKGTIDVAGGQANVDVEIDMASVFSDAPKLTTHLLSADFFDVAQFPTARFTSKSIAVTADGKSDVTGDLTLHGVTKTISFPATVVVTPTLATAKAAFGINRKDFGIVYPGKPDDLIKDEVLLKLDVTAKPAS
ncbi:MAG: YceI family protein [Deltaproteobacteria bacterium]|nr:YceI family protein [Deltaproteobacteria bacterium]